MSNQVRLIDGKNYVDVNDRGNGIIQIGGYCFFYSDLLPIIKHYVMGGLFGFAQDCSLAPSKKELQAIRDFISETKQLKETKLKLRFNDQENIIFAPEQIKTKQTQKQYIPVNIWDDYYDDGHVPKGKKQETTIYIEDHDRSINFKNDALKFLLNHILTLKEFKKVVFKLNKDKIEAINLTHKLRHKLVTQLQQSNLAFNGISFKFYSES